MKAAGTAIVVAMPQLTTYITIYIVVNVTLNITQGVVCHSSQSKAVLYAISLNWMPT